MKAAAAGSLKAELLYLETSLTTGVLKLYWLLGVDVFFDRFRVFTHGMLLAGMGTDEHRRTDGAIRSNAITLPVASVARTERRVARVHPSPPSRCSGPI
jgi:hypothetical protein